MNCAKHKAGALCQKSGLMRGGAASAVLALPAAMSLGVALARPAAAQAVCEASVAVTQRNEALLAEISQINLELLRRRALE